MSRMPRIEFPGAFFHVLARGNNKQDIFRNKQDYRVYIDRLNKYHKRYKFILYAYVLMANHVHLLVETDMIPLSKIMQGIQQSYTAYFHKKYDSMGHVFQGRYKAILCQRDNYLLELVRYIHLNPVRVGLVDTPEDFSWSSHQVYIGRLHQPFVKRDLILKMLSEDELSEERVYSQFIRDGIRKGYQDPFDNVVDHLFLGNIEFVAGLKKRIKGQERTASKKKDKYRKGLEEPVIIREKTLTEIMNAVTQVTHISSESILGMSREQLTSRARILYAFVAVRHSGKSNKSVAEHLGREINSVSYMIRIIDEKMSQDKVILDQLDRITELLEA